MNNKIKIIFNIIVMTVCVIGIMTIGLFVHELSHYYDVNSQGVVVNSFSVWCFGECLNDSAGYVTYYENSQVDVVSSELKAYSLQLLVVILLVILVFYSELIMSEQKNNEKK